MVYRIALIGVLVGGAAWATGTAPSRGERAAAEKEGVIDPQADAQLKRMSDYLASLKTFRVDTTTVDEKVATDGQKIQYLRESKLTVRRPDGLLIDRQGPLGHVIFRYDGKRFSVQLPDKNQYGMAPAPDNLDEAIDAARDRLHVDAPGGDLLVSDTYHDLTDGVIEARYIGKDPVGNVMAHHLALTKKDVDFQIWIQDGDQPVPLRYVITTKDLPGRPQFTLELRNWQPNAPVSRENFAFAPPPDATKIDLTPPRKAAR
jgi:hypothetical protein